MSDSRQLTVSMRENMSESQGVSNTVNTVEDRGTASGCVYSLNIHKQIPERLNWQPLSKSSVLGNFSAVARIPQEIPRRVLLPKSPPPKNCWTIPTETESPQHALVHVKSLEDSRVYPPGILKSVNALEDFSAVLKETESLRHAQVHVKNRQSSDGRLTLTNNKVVPETANVIKKRTTHRSKLYPTLLICGIDAKETLRKYLEGVFFDILPSSIPKNIEIKATQIVLPESDTFDQTKGSYLTGDSNNFLQRNVVTGYTDFCLFSENSCEPSGEYVCKSCLCTWSHPYIGKPTKHVRQVVKLGATTSIYVDCFWTVWKFCTFECMLWNVRETLCNNPQEMEILVKKLFYKMYPASDELFPSNDPLLLKTNGGSLSHEEWCKRGHMYKKTGKTVNFPAKIEHMLLKV